MGTPTVASRTEMQPDEAAGSRRSRDLFLFYFTLFTAVILRTFDSIVQDKDHRVIEVGYYFLNVYRGE